MIPVFLDKQRFSPDERTRRIAGLFAGIPKRVFEQTAREIPLIRDAARHVVRGDLSQVLAIALKQNVPGVSRWERDGRPGLRPTFAAPVRQQ